MVDLHAGESAINKGLANRLAELEVEREERDRAELEEECGIEADTYEALPDPAEDATEGLRHDVNNLTHFVDRLSIRCEDFFRRNAGLEEARKRELHDEERRARLFAQLAAVYPGMLLAPGEQVAGLSDGVKTVSVNLFAFAVDGSGSAVDRRKTPPGPTPLEGPTPRRPLDTPKEIWGEVMKQSCPGDCPDDREDEARIQCDGEYVVRVTNECDVVCKQSNRLYEGVFLSYKDARDGMLKRRDVELVMKGDELAVAERRLSAESVRERREDFKRLEELGIDWDKHWTKKRTTCAKHWGPR